ncbi:MAG: S8/S53 family peptidase [Phycisphaerae bacterium]|nr:S8/S53 family peptidase [Phycisphaerae bacterium]
MADPEVFESYEPGLFLAKIFRARRIFLPKCHFWVPMDSRTTASPIGSDEYVFYSIGGVSCAIPYIAGVYALAVQEDPAITPERFWALAVQTGRTIELDYDGETMPLGPIIDPVRLMRSIQAGESATLNRQHSDTQSTETHPQTHSGAHTIVPGVGVGDYTLGMSKDQVLKKPGQPEGISFVMDDGVVKEISVRSPLYKFSNGLGVGDSEGKIKQAFGKEFELEEFEPKDLLTYEGKGLQFEIDKKNRTIREIAIVKQPEGDRGDRDAPDSVKVIRLSEQSPGPITFPKIDRKPEPLPSGRFEMKSLPKFDPDSPSAFGVNLRCRDLSKLDLSKSIDDLLYAVFDDYTVWPKSGQMPEEFDPKKMMELGKNPGLGVRTLHKGGITGKGVGVAIIDQPLLTEHQEYADRLRLYEENNVRDGHRSEMHGPAVASIAVGKTVGVAPDADLYYIATRNYDVSRDDDPPNNFVFKAQSIRRLLDINRQLPADRKIRVISMSRGWSPSDDGYDDIMAACEEAKAAGIFVASCSLDRVYGFDFFGLGRHPLANPGSFKSYEPGAFWARSFYDGALLRDLDCLLVPMDSRTLACARGSDKYVWSRVGGFSWAIPYIAGVYALAVQVDPAITPERFWDLAMKTGRTIELEHKGEKRSFGPIIDPVALISSLQNN